MWQGHETPHSRNYYLGERLFDAHREQRAFKIGFRYALVGTSPFEIYDLGSS